jgi:hypothetical protein
MFPCIWKLHGGFLGEKKKKKKKKKKGNKKGDKKVKIGAWISINYIGL